MSDCTIRAAAEQDLDSVLCLWDQAGSLPSVTDTREGLLALLGADDQALLLAESQGMVVGSLIAAWDGWRGSFYRLAVHPDWRRRGIATKLLRELGGATVIGPILVGLDRSVQIVPLSANDAQLVNMAALAAYNVSG